MLTTMYAAKGIGLAAPQVGIDKRIIVIDIAYGNEAPTPIKIINPEIVSSSRELFICKEGCLSLPDQWSEISRPAAVVARYLDETGAERYLDAKGMLAVCLQHELDHLNGILFIDHVSSLKRDIILRKLQKIKKKKHE